MNYFTEEQKRFVADMDRDDVCSLDRPEPNPNDDFGRRVADSCLVEVAPEEFINHPNSEWDIVAGPNSPATAFYSLAAYRVHVTDRTGWDICGVTVTIHGQAVGLTNTYGIFSSRRFKPGTYSLKFHSDYTTPSRPRGQKTPGWELGWEFETQGTFTVGILDGACELSLLANRMGVDDRVVDVFSRMTYKVGPALKEELKAFASPMVIGMLGSLLLLWGAGHFVGVSETVDVIVLFAGGFAEGLEITLTAMQVVDFFQKIWKMCMTIADAKDEFDLDEAGQLLAEAVAMVTLAVALDLLIKAIKKVSEPTWRPTEEGVRRSPDTERKARCKEIMGEDAYEARARAVLAKMRRSTEFMHLTDEEIVALRAYTDNLSTGLAKAYPKWGPVKDWEFFNRGLREGDVEMYVRFADYLDTMVQALEKVKPRTAKVARVMKYDAALAKKMRPGKVFIEKGFMSTSLDETYLTREWAGGYEKAIVMKIHARSGRYLEEITMFPGQEELLLPPGRRLFVVKTAEVKVTAKAKALNAATGKWETVMVPKRVKNAAGVLEDVTEWTWVGDKMQSMPVMEPKLIELPAKKVYAVEIREDLDEFVNLWGHGVEFFHLLEEMAKAHKHEEHEEHGS